MDPEISNAKFRVPRECLAHQQYTLWTLAGGTTQNPGGSAKSPTAKFATANLTWREIPPPPHVLDLTQTAHETFDSRPVR